MVKAAPAAAFVVRQPDLLLELLIVALDAPTQFGGIDQIVERNIMRQGREPVFGRGLLAFGPLDQQPFFARLIGPFMAGSDVNPHPRKAR